MLVPDYVEPILGWRAWRLVEEGDEVLLSSVVYPQLWRPREATRATCRPYPSAVLHASHHAAPNRDCVCGVYAGATAAHAEPYVDGYTHLIGNVPVVLGRVSLWGTVVEATDGWRASDAYPRELYVPGRSRAWDAEQTAAALISYGVPVTVLDCEPRRGVLGRALASLAA